MYKDVELEALKDQDSCQTQEKLARTSGVTQQAISHSLIINAEFLIKNGGNLFVHLIHYIMQGFPIRGFILIYKKNAFFSEKLFDFYFI